MSYRPAFSAWALTTCSLLILDARGSRSLKSHSNANDSADSLVIPARNGSYSGNRSAQLTHSLLTKGEFRAQLAIPAIGLVQH